MHVFSGWRIGAPLLIVLLKSPPAAAQEPPPANAAPSPTEGDHLRIGFLLQTDARFIPPTRTPVRRHVHVSPHPPDTARHGRRHL